MKPFFGIDLTSDKNNETLNGDEFLVQKPSQALSDAFERSAESTVEAFKKAKMPLPLRIAQWICGSVALLVAVGILKSLGGDGGISITTAYKNATAIFWLGGACAVVWAALWLAGNRKHKTTLESDESAQVFDDFNQICDNIISDLGVPPTAKEVDILSFFYKVKGDKIKVCEKGMQTVAYRTSVVHAYADAENLYLTNLDGKYAFPLASLKGITTVNKTIMLDSWNKEEGYKEGRYSEYKIGENQYGITSKTYHILEVEQNGETFGIYFPCYELPIFEQLTGLTAIEAK